MAFIPQEGSMKFIASIFLISSVITHSALAATYYVKPDGNDNADGKSHETAWKTLARVNSHAARKGDDVYLLAGGVWNLQQLIINWNGSADNRAIIGAYYMNNNKETAGVPSGTSKPAIIGSYIGPCSGKPGSCINTSDAVPPKAYSGLIKINSNYVTIQNIRVQNSAGRGIVLNKKRKHAVLENNEVYYTAGNSIIFGRGTSYNIMRNNDTSLCAIGWKHGDWIAVSKTWPTCNSAVGSHHNIFEGNYIHESYGEGIVMLRGSNYNIVRGNKIVAVRSTNIYMDNSSNNIVENNLLVGDRDSKYTYHRAHDGHMYGGGIDVKVESYKKMHDSINNIVRNNLLVRTGGLLMGLERKAEQAGMKVGVKFLNNTLVETAAYVKLHDSSQHYDSVEIANNIFHGSPQGDKGCKITPTNIDIHHNHWDTNQTDKGCIGSTGDKIDDPKLNRKNWDNIGVNNIPQASDFALSLGSTAINYGKHISNHSNNDLLHTEKLTADCSSDISDSSQDDNCKSINDTPDMSD